MIDEDFEKWKIADKEWIDWFISHADADGRIDLDKHPIFTQWLIDNLTPVKYKMPTQEIIDGLAPTLDYDLDNGRFG